MWLNHKPGRHPPALRIGCSGWQYHHWRGDFYPSGLPQSRWFAQYARTFDTVEINNSFYRLPEAATFASWKDQAPPGFLYAVKASRFLTHMKKLKDPGDPLRRFFENALHLGPCLGPVLYQLPPRWPLNLERLHGFLEALAELPLPARPLHVLEFRDPSWYDERALTLLEQYGVALCLHDMPGSATGQRRVGPFVYVRFHGVTRYGGRYDDERLDEWAHWMAGRLRQGIDVFAYFNNDVGGHAPRDAVRLRDRLRPGHEHMHQPPRRRSTADRWTFAQDASCGNWRADDECHAFPEGHRRNRRTAGVSFQASLE